MPFDQYYKVPTVYAIIVCLSICVSVKPSIYQNG